MHIWSFYETTPLQYKQCITNSSPCNIFILNVVFSGVFLTGSWFCKREKFGIDLVLVSVSVVPPVCQTTKATVLSCRKSSSSQIWILFIAK